MEGLIFGGAYLRREIDWASLIVESKFTVFALFYFVFEGNFPSTSPRGAYIWRSYLTEGYFCVSYHFHLGCLYSEGLVQPCYSVSLLPCCFVPLLLSVTLGSCYLVTLFPCYSCYLVTLFPCYSVTLLLCSLVTLFPCSLVTLFPCYLVTLLPVNRGSTVAKAVGSSANFDEDMTVAVVTAC